MIVGEGRIEPEAIKHRFYSPPAGGSTYGLLFDICRGGWVRTSMQPVILSTLYKSEGIHLALLWERNSNHAFDDPKSSVLIRRSQTELHFQRSLYYM